MRMISKLKKATKMPLDVLFFRLAQALKVRQMRSGGWERVAQKIEIHFTSVAIIEQITIAKSDIGNLSFLKPDAIQDIRGTTILNAVILRNIRAHAELVHSGKVEIFGSQVDLDDNFFWDRDWRFDHRWIGSGPFYFYGPREEPVDVKFPWELSRLKLLVDLLQIAVLDDRPDYIRTAKHLFDDWRMRNPVGRSVNWVPMEASMRAISLFVAMELCILSDNNNAMDLFYALSASLAEHGEYLFVMREYTGNRGNHYTANIVALYLISVKLTGIWPTAQKWRTFARTEIENEIFLQFLDDGVNFEKSTSYHLLVTELYLQAMIVAENEDEPLSDSAKARIKAACLFAQSAIAPDGTIIALGDCDDATGLPLGPAFPNNTGELIGLANGFFQDGVFQNNRLSVTARWVGFSSPEMLAPNLASTGYYNQFSQSHMHFVRSADRYFWVDMGEVGQNGLGGHGHNDLFSFGLWLGNKSIVIDPGTYMYTGDLQKRTWFRSTAAHNGNMVDDMEIAPLLGHWRISNIAAPYGHHYHDDGEAISICASHDGYQRLPDPVIATRKFWVKRNLSKIKICDNFACKADHIITRHLHLSPNLQVKIEHNVASIKSEGENIACITFDENSTLSTIPSWCSEQYGQSTPTTAIRVCDEISGNTNLYFQIEEVE